MMDNQLKLTLSSGVVHGLKCRVKGRDEILTIIGYDNHLNSVRVKIGEYAFYTRVDDIELLMHPISRLTEPILPDGKIPIVELAKMAFKYYNWELDETNKWPTAKCDEGYFQFWDNCFYWFSGGIISAPNQLVLFDKLDAWHINYRGVEAVEI